MKILISLIGIIIIAGYLTGCTDNQISKTKDFTPGIVNYEFYIEGEIDDKLLRYRQINYDWTNVSNKYFIDSEETWLQAYTDSIGENRGYWNIRIHDIDIMNIAMPYTLLESEGSVTWYDQRIDAIMENNSNCQGIDSGCTFILRSGEYNITLTSNANNILEGTFHGRAVIIGTDFTIYSDNSLFHEIENGKFRIEYRVE